MRIQPYIPVSAEFIRAVDAQVNAMRAADKQRRAKPVKQQSRPETSPGVLLKMHNPQTVGG